MGARLVVLEGIDGSGKTSAWRGLQSRRAAADPGILWGRDPGDTRVGGRLREILLDPENAELAPAAELLLYLASRAQLVHERVAPALDAGRTVVLDRYWLSTLAYQGVAGVLPPDALRETVSIGLGRARYPDLVVWLDVPVAVAWSRVSARSDAGVDRMEARGPGYLEAVRARYEDELSRLPDSVRVARVDATLPPERVLERVEAEVFPGG